MKRHGRRNYIKPKTKPLIWLEYKTSIEPGLLRDGPNKALFIKEYFKRFPKQVEIFNKFMVDNEPGGN